MLNSLYNTIMNRNRNGNTVGRTSDPAVIDRNKKRITSKKNNNNNNNSNSSSSKSTSKGANSIRIPFKMNNNTSNSNSNSNSTSSSINGHRQSKLTEYGILENSNLTGIVRLTKRKAVESPLTLRSNSASTAESESESESTNESDNEPIMDKIIRNPTFYSNQLLERQRREAAAAATSTAAFNHSTPINNYNRPRSSYTIKPISIDRNNNRSNSNINRKSTTNTHSSPPSTLRLIRTRSRSNSYSESGTTPSPTLIESSQLRLNQSNRNISTGSASSNTSLNSNNSVITSTNPNKRRRIIRPSSIEPESDVESGIEADAEAESDPILTNRSISLTHQLLLNNEQSSESDSDFSPASESSGSDTIDSDGDVDAEADADAAEPDADADATSDFGYQSNNLQDTPSLSSSTSSSSTESMSLLTLRRRRQLNPNKPSKAVHKHHQHPHTAASESADYSSESATSSIVNNRSKPITTVQRVTARTEFQSAISDTTDSGFYDIVKSFRQFRHLSPESKQLQLVDEFEREEEQYEPLSHLYQSIQSELDFLTGPADLHGPLAFRELLLIFFRADHNGRLRRLCLHEPQFLLWIINVLRRIRFGAIELDQLKTESKSNTEEQQPIYYVVPKRPDDSSEDEDFKPDDSDSDSTNADNNSNNSDSESDSSNSTSNSDSSSSSSSSESDSESSSNSIVNTSRNNRKESGYRQLVFLNKGALLRETLINWPIIPVSAFPTSIRPSNSQSLLFQLNGKPVCNSYILSSSSSAKSNKSKSISKAMLQRNNLNNTLIAPLITTARSISTVTESKNNNNTKLINKRSINTAPAAIPTATATATITAVKLNAVQSKSKSKSAPPTAAPSTTAASRPTRQNKSSKPQSNKNNQSATAPATATASTNKSKHHHHQHQHQHQHRIRLKPAEFSSSGVRYELDSIGTNSIESNNWFHSLILSRDDYHLFISVLIYLSIISISDDEHIGNLKKIIFFNGLMNETQFGELNATRALRVSTAKKSLFSEMMYKFDAIALELIQRNLLPTLPLPTLTELTINRGN